MRTRTRTAEGAKGALAPVKATPQFSIFTFIRLPRVRPSVYQMAFTFIRASTSPDPGLLTAPSLAHP